MLLEEDSGSSVLAKAIYNGSRGVVLNDEGSIYQIYLDSHDKARYLEEQELVDMKQDEIDLLCEKVWEKWGIRIK